MNIDLASLIATIFFGILALPRITNALKRARLNKALKVTFSAGSNLSSPDGYLLDFQPNRPLSDYMNNDLIISNDDFIELEIENTSDKGRILVANFVYVRILTCKTLPELIVEYEVPKDGLGGGASYRFFEGAVLSSSTDAFALELSYLESEIFHQSQAKFKFKKPDYDYLYVEPDEIESIRVYTDFEPGYYYEFDLMIPYKVGRRIQQFWSSKTFKYISPIRTVRLKPDRITPYDSDMEAGTLADDYMAYPPVFYNQPIKVYSGGYEYDELAKRKNQIESLVNSSFLPDVVKQTRKNTDFNIDRLGIDPEIKVYKDNMLF